MYTIFIGDESAQMHLDAAKCTEAAQEMFITRQNKPVLD